jgi:hypothetical protein
LPLVQANIEVELEPGRALVALIRRLGQELVNNAAEHVGDVGLKLAHPPRRARQMTMHPFDRIVGHEGQLTREHLVKGDAQRIQIGALIDCAAHAPRLLGGNIGERALQSEAAQLDLVGRLVDDQALRPDAAMQNSVAVHLGERRGGRGGDAQKAPDVHRLAEELIEPCAVVQIGAARGRRKG